MTAGDDTGDDREVRNVPAPRVVYLEDPYAREVETVVAAAEGPGVALRETPFYPGGGGLPPDRGRLRWEEHAGGAGPGAAHGETVEASVTGHRREGSGIWHDLDRAAPPPGTAVRAVVDWPHRYGIMRHHSAAHVLSGVVYHLFGATVTGGQIYADRARLDFALGDLDPSRISAIEVEANRIIREGRPITAREISREEFERHDLVRTARNLVPEHLARIRVVEIEGFDAQADGGTHVRDTREIGTLRIVKTENKGKVNRRLEIALDP